MIKKIQAIIKKYPVEFFLGLFAALASGDVAIFIYRHNLMTILADQSAHLNFARLLTDSVTPGVSQLGIWPPLLHLIMMPAAMVPWLYQTGVAGYVTILPFFVISVILFYRLLLRLFASVRMAVFGAVIYMTNPFVLYYSATPMMEILLLCFVISTAYFCVRWIDDSRLRDLLFMGISVALAGLSRFEGLLLFPIVSGIVLVQLVRKKYSYEKIEATLVLFWYLACVGIATLMVYDLVYFGNALAFLGVGTTPSWSLENPSAGKAYLEHPFLVFLHASYYMLGFVIVWLALASALFAGALSRKRFSLISTMGILAVPAFAVILSMGKNSSIYVPEFSALHDFHNVRYALTWAPFAALSLAAFPAALLSRLSTKSARAITALFMVVVLGISGAYFYTEAVKNTYLTIRSDRSATRETGVSPAAGYFKESYDYGFIFLNRFGNNNDKMMRETGLPLSQYLYEGNNLYYQDTFETPWLYARYVFMLDPTTLKDNGSRSPITEKWWDSEEFQYYYELVFAENYAYVYRVREEAVLEYARNNSIPSENITSLSRGTTLWKPNQKNP